MKKYFELILFKIALFLAPITPVVVALVDRISHLFGFCVGH